MTQAGLLSTVHAESESIPVSPIPAVNVASVPQRSPLRYPGGQDVANPPHSGLAGNFAGPTASVD